jgi:CheY-like chemotaxis protein
MTQPIGQKSTLPSSSFLLVEDDPFAVEWVGRIVKDRFATRVIIDRVSSEREFLLRLRELERKRYAAIILDVILPWEDGVALEAATAYPVPRGDAYEAGTRILQDLRNSTILRDIPIVMYSVNDEERIAWPEGLAKPKFINKAAPDFLLLEWLENCLRNPS